MMRWHNVVRICLGLYVHNEGSKNNAFICELKLSCTHVLMMSMSLDTSVKLCCLGSFMVHIFGLQFIDLII